MKEFFLKIISAFDPRGSKEAENATGSLAESMRAAAREGGVLGGVTAAIGNTLSNLAGGIINKATEAIHKLGEMVARTVEEFAESQVKMTALDQALAQQGKLTDDYRERLSNLASQLQETTAIADEQWMGVLTTLTKFGADSSNIDRYADAVKNLAGFLGGDIEQAAFLFGKAMTGSTEMLGRYGIEVDKAKTVTEQLEQIMAQVAERGGGQLEARAKTLSGQWAGLKLATSDLFEAFGRLISNTGVLQTTMQLLGTATAFWAKTLGGTPELVEGVTNKLVMNKRSTEEVESVTKQYGKSLEGIQVSSKAASEALVAQIKIVGELAAAESKAANARGELQLAQLDAKGIDGAEKLKAEAEIRAATRREIREIEARQAAQEVAMLQQAIQKAETEAHDRERTYLDQLAKTEIADDYARQQQKMQAKAATASAAIESAQKSLADYQQQLEVFGANGKSDPMTDQLREDVEFLERFIKLKQRALQESEAYDKNAVAAAETERQKLAILQDQNKTLSEASSKEREQAQSRIDAIKRQQESAEQLAAITERTSQIKDLIAQRDALSASLEKQKKESSESLATVSGGVAETATDEAKARERALAAINAQIAALSKPTGTPQNQLASDLERLRRNAALNESNPVSVEFYKQEIANVVAKMAAAGQSAQQTIANVSVATGSIAQGAAATSEAAATTTQALQTQSQAAAEQINTQLQAVLDSINASMEAITAASAATQEAAESSSTVISESATLNQEQIDLIAAQLQGVVDASNQTLGSIAAASASGQLGAASLNAAVSAHAAQLAAQFAGAAAGINSIGGTVSEGFAKMGSAISGTQARLQNQINRLEQSISALWNRV